MSHLTSSKIRININDHFQMYHPILHDFFANSGKGKVSEVAEDQKKAQRVVKRDKEFLDRTLSKADTVLKGISEFWTESLRDGAGVSREMSSFDSYLMHTNGLPTFNYITLSANIYMLAAEETILTQSVNALKDLIARLDKVRPHSYPHFACSLTGFELGLGNEPSRTGLFSL